MILLIFWEEIVKFIFYSLTIVLISKHILVTSIRKLAEYLKLNSKTIGSLAGYATSVPEFLTVAASSINGLIGTSMYNILSSNVINFLQYTTSIFINKNQSVLRNNIVKIEILLVIITILLPIFFIRLNLEINIITIVIFVFLYVFFRYIDSNVHKLYSNEKVDNKKNKSEGKDWKNAIKYIIFLIFSSVLLFIIGNLLGQTLENLCYRFNVPELIIGILLGSITSIPELITFFESQKHHTRLKNKEAGVIEATNNLFTSNILNLFIIQSIGVLIYIVFA